MKINPSTRAGSVCTAHEAFALKIGQPGTTTEAKNAEDDGNLHPLAGIGRSEEGGIVIAVVIERTDLVGLHNGNDAQGEAAEDGDEDGTDHVAVGAGGPGAALTE